MTQTTTREKASGGGALTATRAIAGSIAVLVFIQGALAGSFLDGTTGAIALHGVGASVLSLLGIAGIVTAAAAHRANRWVVPAAVVGFLGLGLQSGMGYGRVLNIHVPLGIALFGLYLSMALLLRDQRTIERRQA